MYFHGWSLFLYLTICGPCQSFWIRAPWRLNCFTFTDTGRRACVSITAMSYSDCDEGWGGMGNEKKRKKKTQRKYETLQQGYSRNPSLAIARHPRNGHPRYELQYSDIFDHCKP